MKIVLVTSDFPSASRPLLGKKRLELATKLIQRGHEVSIITVGNVNGVVSQVYKELSVIRVPEIWRFPSVYYPVPNFKLLRKSIVSIAGKFDILHFYKQGYLISLSAFFKINKPKVLTIDSFAGLDYEHGSFLWDSAGFLHSMTVTRLLLKEFDRLISLSRASVRTAIKLGAKEEKIHWIPHGIDTNKIKPDPETKKFFREKMQFEAPVFSFVGRLSSVKGIVYLVKAAKELDRKGVKGDLLIIGDGPQRDKLHELRETENIRIHFLGYRKNAVDFIQTSDFIVLPSLGEGCPNVILEALACGKPVIASNVGGVPDLVQHMETGILVDAKNVRQLTNAIATLVTNPRKVKTMGKNARKFAERELDWDAIIEKNEKVYLNAVE